MKSGNIGLMALLTGALSCSASDVDLVPPSDAASVPVTPVHGACTATASVLARIPGILSRPLEIDGADLYVVALGEGGASDETLWRVPLAGGAPQTLASGQDHVGGIAIDQGAGTVPAPVFWSTGSTGPGGAIWRSDSASGTQAIVTERASPGALIVLGRRVYWGEGQSGGAQGCVEWAPVAGGAASTLQQLTGDDIPQTFDGDDTMLVWTTESAALGNASTARILSAPLPLPFGALNPIAAGAAGVELTRAGLVYSGPRALTRVIWPTVGASPALQTIPTGGFVETIEEDATHVYYVDRSTGTLMQVGIDGAASSPRSLAGGLDPASALQADGTCVYWIDAITQTVMMVHS